MHLQVNAVAYPFASPCFPSCWYYLTSRERSSDVPPQLDSGWLQCCSLRLSSDFARPLEFIMTKRIVNSEGCGSRRKRKTCRENTFLFHFQGKKNSSISKKTIIGHETSPSTVSGDHLWFGSKQKGWDFHFLSHDIDIFVHSCNNYV